MITLPFVVTLVVAGLARVDRTLEEAAMDLGAVPRQVIWRATLPQMRGALAAAAAFAFIISFDELDATIFIVGQTDNTLPVSMFIYMEKYQDPTLAALSTLLIGGALILGVAIAVLMARIGGLRARCRGRAGGHRRTGAKPLIPPKEETTVTDTASIAAAHDIAHVPVATIANGHTLELVIHSIRGAGDGPTLGVMAGIHGDEPLGVETVRRLARSSTWTPSAASWPCCRSRIPTRSRA